MVIFILVVGISFLILIHEFGHFLAARRFGLLVEEFGIGFPPRLFSKKIGETVWSINALPFGGFVKIHGEKQEEPGSEASGDTVDPRRSFSHLSVGRRALIIAAGVVMNFFLGWLLISGVYAVGTPEKILIQDVSPGAPAEIAGFKAGDTIDNFSSMNEFIAYVNASKGKEIQVTVERDTKTLILTAIPRLTVPEGEGALGISLTELGVPPLSIPASLVEGFKASVNILWVILSSLGTLFLGFFKGRAPAENFVGPVGIFQIANASARFGLAHLFQLIGLISLNLTVINILPIPALDGGRLFFLLIEKIKGSPIGARREGVANMVGFMLLILLMVVITVHDLVRIF